MPLPAAFPCERCLIISDRVQLRHLFVSGESPFRLSITLTGSTFLEERFPFIMGPGRRGAGVADRRRHEAQTKTLSGPRLWPPRALVPGAAGGGGRAPGRSGREGGISSALRRAFEIFRRSGPYLSLIHSPTPSFIHYRLLPTSPSVPGTLLGAGDTAGHATGEVPVGSLLLGELDIGRVIARLTNWSLCG